MVVYSNPALRVAYIDEVEEGENGKVQKVYYSVLVKAVDTLDQVIILKTITKPPCSLTMNADCLCFLSYRKSTV